MNLKGIVDVITLYWYSATSKSPTPLMLASKTGQNKQIGIKIQRRPHSILYWASSICNMTRIPGLLPYSSLLSSKKDMIALIPPAPNP